VSPAKAPRPSRRRYCAAFGVLLVAAIALFPHGARAQTQSASQPHSPAPAPATPADATLVRVTSSFEVGHASAVLRQVAKLFSAGFVRKDAEQVAKLIDALSAEQSRSWEFNGLHKGVSYPLRVRARIDEFGQLDLDFFTAPALVMSVRGAVDGYLNARGL
jgi:hypothetical protein